MYATTDQTKELYNATTGVAGTELAAHTMYHCSLVIATTTDDATHCQTNLTAEQQAVQNQRELVDARTALQNQFSVSGVPLFSFNNLASPYGAYNDTSIAEIKADNYTSHRSTDGGINSFDTLNPFNIMVINVGPNPTNDPTLFSYDLFKQYVDAAAANNQWVVFVYHDVSPAGQPVVDYGVSATDLATQFKYVADKQATNPALQVVTVAEAIAEHAAGAPATTTPAAAPQAAATAPAATPATTSETQAAPAAEPAVVEPTPAQTTPEQTVTPAQPAAEPTPAATQPSIVAPVVTVVN